MAPADGRGAASRRHVLVLLALCVGLLIPGLTLPVLTLRGVLQPEALAQVAPDLIEAGIGETAVSPPSSPKSPDFFLYSS